MLLIEKGLGGDGLCANSTNLPDRIVLRIRYSVDPARKVVSSSGIRSSLSVSGGLELAYRDQSLFLCRCHERAVLPERDRGMFGACWLGRGKRRATKQELVLGETMSVPCSGSPRALRSFTNPRFEHARKCKCQVETLIMLFLQVRGLCEELP